MEHSETQGFEPWVQVTPYDSLANCSFRPLRHISIRSDPEKVGFEPTVSFPTTVFKTAALNHSATSPVKEYFTDKKGDPVKVIYL